MNSKDGGMAQAVADFAQGYVLASVEIAAAPERVFQALTSREIVDWWVRPGVFDTREWSGDVRVGGRWHATGISRGQPYRLEGEFLEIDPPRKLVHTWHLAGTPGAPTTVTYLLEGSSGGTRLTVRHSGFAASEPITNTSTGWETSLQRLAQVLSRRPQVTNPAVLSVPIRVAAGHISAEERAAVLQWLDESHQEFFAAIDGLSDTQWRWKPAPERWSVGETAEHVVRAEALLFDCVRKAMAAPPNPAWEEQTKGKTELLIQVMPSRQGRAVAPESLVPHERMTRAQVLERFEKQRIDIHNFARETREALKEYTVVHPFPALGTLNAHQWLLYVPLHTIRHDKQIAEIKAAPGYPPD